MRVGGRTKAGALTRREHLRRDRNSAPRLADLYPRLLQLRFELEFRHPVQIAPAPYSHVLLPRAPAFFSYSCPFADCSGGFDLGKFVDGVLQNASSRSVCEIVCEGWRLSDSAGAAACGLVLVCSISTEFSSIEHTN